MRVKHSLLVITATVMIAPAFLHSQFGQGRGPGGAGGGFGGGGGFDPGRLFDRMGKGKDPISRSDVDPQMQPIFDKAAEAAGVKNGVLSRAQYVGSMEKMMSMTRPNPNGGPMSGPPSMTQGGPMDGGGGRQMRISLGGPQGMGGPQVIGSGGTNPVAAQQFQDRMAEDFFNRADKNGDGMLSFEEMSDTLKPLRDKYDANGDGFINLEEYKKFFNDQRSQWNNNNPRPDRKDGTPQDNSDPRQNGPMFNIAPPVEEKKEEEEVRRPALYRAGKLPKELPSWFEELDTDKDGQVGLYEWRRDNRDLYEFESMDFNSDGLLTPEEVLKFLKIVDKQKVASNGKSMGSGGLRMGSGGPSGMGNPGGGNSGGDWASRWGSNTDSGSGQDRKSRGDFSGGASGGIDKANFKGMGFGPKGGGQGGDNDDQPRRKGGDGSGFGGGKDRKKN